MLSQETWVTVYAAKDVNDAYTEFNNIFLYYFDICFPVKRMNIGKTDFNKPWITAEVKIISKQKHDMQYLIRYASSLNLNVNKLKNELKKISKNLKLKIRSAKQSYYSNIINESTNKVKTTWSVINSITKAEKRNDSINSINSLIDNKSVTDPQNIANEFSNYFGNIVQNLNLPEPEVFGIIKNNASSLFLCPVDEIEVYNITLNLKNSMTSGWDNIPNKIIKSSALFTASPLSYIINLSFLQGVFPKLLKRAIIKPLFKKGDKNIITNYRPISLLSGFSKIFERAIYNRLISFLNKYSIIADEQHGFVRNKSINLSVFKAIKLIIDAWNNREHIISIFLDLCKAFDCVSKELILHKLYCYGIRGIALSLIDSYLSERYQSVKISAPDINNIIMDFFSIWINIFRGVPQGSILGPLLFLIFINDLPNIVEDPLFLFADDTGILYKATNPEILSQIITDSLNLLNMWFIKNSMKLNVDKTQAIKFGNYGQKINSLMIANFGNIILEDQVKFLGITIDRNLNWKDHIDILIKKINKFVFVLRHLSYLVNISVLLNVYFSYIHSNLSFGIIFWGNSTSSDKIFKIQKKCIRIIANVGQREHCRSLFQKLKILTIPDLYIFECALFVKKHPNLFKDAHCKHTYDTRNKNMLRTKQSNLSLVQHSVCNSMIRIYNTIPESIKELPINKFKIAFKNFLHENVHYSIKEFLEN